MCVGCGIPKAPKLSVRRGSEVADEAAAGADAEDGASGDLDHDKRKEEEEYEAAGAGRARASPGCVGAARLGTRWPQACARQSAGRREGQGEGSLP